MWESPIYRFEDEITDRNGEIKKRSSYIDVTYSAPRNLYVPGFQLENIFKKITKDKKPEDVKILDVGAAKLRNTNWLLQKKFQVWAVEYPELSTRSEDAKEKWEYAKQYDNFHQVTFPNEFKKLDGKFDVILLINVINVMPIPLERYALISLCRKKIKDNGMLLLHHMRGKSKNPESYTDENAFIDGYLMGKTNHTFYVENSSDECHELMYSLGFIHDKQMSLSKICGNNYSYIYQPKHDTLLSNVLDLEKMLSTPRDPEKVLERTESVSTLELYIKELKLLKYGSTNAYKYQLLTSRIFYEIFRNQLNEPKIESEINDGRGRIDIVYKNANKEGIFKDLKDLRDIPCPNIMVECKNYYYEKDLKNGEYSQLSDRLTHDRGMVGFLLCRSKNNNKDVIQHCRDRHKHGSEKYLIVLDDKDLIELSRLKLNTEDDSMINDFINKKIDEIVD